MTGRRLLPCPWPRRCGDCAVFVSLCQGTAGGPCPQDLLCAAPKHRLASSSLVFMPLYKRQRICRMVFLYVPFKRPSFGFPLLPALVLQPLTPPVGLLGAPSPASGSLSQSSLRMYMSPSCSPPQLRAQGCVRAEGRGGVLPGLPQPVLVLCSTAAGSLHLILSSVPKDAGAPPAPGLGVPSGAGAA